MLVKKREIVERMQPHGDNGRAKTKAEKQIKELEQKARESKSKKERTKIENKIRNIRQNAERKQGGEEHSRSTTKR